MRDLERAYTAADVEVVDISTEGGRDSTKALRLEKEMLVHPSRLRCSSLGQTHGLLDTGSAKP